MTDAEDSTAESTSVLGLHCIKQTENNELLAIITRRVAPRDALLDHPATARLTVFIRKNRMDSTFSDPGKVMKDITVTLTPGESATEVLIDLAAAASRILKDETDPREPRATVTAHLSIPDPNTYGTTLPPGSEPLSNEEYGQILEGRDTASAEAEELLKLHRLTSRIPDIAEMRQRIEALDVEDRTYAAICKTLHEMLSERNNRASATGGSWVRQYLPVYSFIQLLAEYGVMGQHGPPLDAESANLLDGLFRDDHDHMLFTAHFEQSEVGFRDQHHLDRRLVGGPTRNMVTSWY
ncbi:hypothetical protein [Streptomyces sp. NBC_00687]|uniref:hypothetical protein n=1 Tax=Streptomyces sp. NBC_00687 TaxID=2975807 RepID=UPI002250FE59|nr:hypothetical protein [Streptomyces sp. NBC_00687]MCX4912011.1 hypothetical protein [Streptomyces sp. NBC_00687]